MDKMIETKFLQGYDLSKEKQLQKEAIEKFRDSSVIKNEKGETQKNILNLSSAASSAATILGLNKVRKGPAAPVYVVNKNKDKTYEWIKEYLPKLWMGLQSVMGSNLAAPAAIAVTALSEADSLLKDTAGALGMDMNASGAKATAKKKVSHFISGDSKTGKENKEQVSIDWEKHSYNVKPIPKYANGGKENMSGRSFDLTNSERGAPMSVGVTSNLISYSRQLQGVKDDGSGKAIKVYSVNPGITDKVDLNGSNISLMELVGSIYTALGNLISVSTTESEILGVIAGNTGVTAAKIGSSSSSSNESSASFPTNLNSILRGV